MANQLVWSDTIYRASTTFIEGYFPTYDNTHLLVAVLQIGTTVAPATPAGWTAVTGSSANGANQVRAYIKQGTGTDNGFNVTFSSASATFIALIFKGYSSSTMLQAAGASNASNTTASLAFTASGGTYGAAMSVVGVLNTVAWGSWVNTTRTRALSSSAQRLDVAHTEFNGSAISTSISWTTSRTSRSLKFIIPLLLLPEITTLTLNALDQGMAFSQTLVATFTTSATWTHTGGTIPSGLSLSSDGVLSGTPTTSGAYNFTVTITDANGTDTQQYIGTITAAPSTLQPVASYAFDEGTRTFAQDATGNNHGFLVNAGVWTTNGHTNSAVEGIIAADISQLSRFNAPIPSSNKRTVMAWVRIDSIPASGVSYLIYGAVKGGTGDYEAFGIVGANVFYWRSIGSVWRTWDNKAPTAPGWYHFAVTSGQDGLFLFIDGVLEGSYTTPGVETQLPVSLHFITLGHEYEDNVLDGAIDDLRIFDNRIDSDITYWMNTPVTPLVPTSAWYLGTGAPLQPHVLTAEGLIELE